MMKASVLSILLLAAAVSCSSLENPGPSEHVVAAPISARANTVLENLVTEYGSSDGRWLRCMSPGCTQIWATQFGYRAGVRRDRDDVLAIGRTTARRQSADLRGLLWDAVFGDLDSGHPAVFGFPALLVSGTLGRRPIDKIMFTMGIDRLDERLDPERMGKLENAGLAALLATVAPLQPERRAERLEQARRLAEGAAGGGGGTWAFLAWAAIARASGAEEDVRRARAAEAAMRYRFDPETGALLPPAEEDEVLSRHLSAIHGHADLAQATGDPASRARAVALLDYLFSDAYFDGHFLVHHLNHGERAEEVCSGCNFMALHLVDRLYGDSFVIDPVPALPPRDWPELDELRERAWALLKSEGEEHRLVLSPGAEGEEGTASLAVTPLDPEGRVLVLHETLDARVALEYRIQSPEQQPPHGGVKLRARNSGRDIQLAGRSWEFSLDLDAEGSARLSNHGFEPLIWSVEISRSDDGTFSGTFEVREGDD